MATSMLRACVNGTGTMFAASHKMYSTSWIHKVSLPITQCTSNKLLISSHLKVLQCSASQSRLLSNPPPKKNFFGQIIDNVRQEMTRNKEMKESIKKFREEADKLEHSEALQKARQKYQSFESETSRSSAVLKEKLGQFREKLQETVEEVQKSELAKKAGQVTEEFAKSAKGAAEAVSEKGNQLGQSTAFKTISESVKAVKQEIDEATISKSRVYRAPEKLRRRVETVYKEDEKPVEPNLEATGVELHKDSRWYQSWQNFKDNNPYVNKVFDWKTKYDESDNPLVRASRAITDKATDIFGGIFQKTELSQVLTEICKMDPNFDKEQFLKEVEYEIIPNILEAMIRGDLEILRDWCYEAPFNAIATPIKQAQAMGLHFASEVLDVSNVDLVLGKIMEQGPVLAVSFQTQQIMAVKNKKGEVVEGDPEKILRMYYVWVLCRDQTELDPKAAWKLMDLSANSVQQWL